MDSNDSRVKWTLEEMNLMGAGATYTFREEYSNILSLLSEEDELAVRQALDAYYFNYDPGDLSHEASRALIAILGIAATIGEAYRETE